MENLHDRVTVVIKTFIRYQTLRRTIRRIKSVWPGLHIIVVDDTPLKLRKPIAIPGVTFVVTEPDIGLSAGRNRGFAEASTEYVLYTDDDAFPHASSSLADLEHLVKQLDAGLADLIGWRGWTINENGGRLSFRGVRPGDLTVCQVTENAYIARRAVLVQNPHPEEIKINGEHFSFFYLLYKAKVKVRCSKLLRFINTKARNPEYTAYRNRTYRKAAKRATGYQGALWQAPSADSGS
jgi:glycosyltransferase involved in cell wall biosynthesis